MNGIKLLFDRWTNRSHFWPSKAFKFHTVQPNIIQCTFGAQHTAEKWRIEQSHLVRIRGCGLSPRSIKPLEIHFHPTFARHPDTHLFSQCGCLFLQVSAIHHTLCGRTRTKFLRLLPRKRIYNLSYHLFIHYCSCLRVKNTMQSVRATHFTRVLFNTKGVSEFCAKRTNLLLDSVQVFAKDFSKRILDCFITRHILLSVFRLFLVIFAQHYTRKDCDLLYLVYFSWWK